MSVENKKFPNRKPDLHWPKVGVLNLVSGKSSEWRLVCTSCGRDIRVPEMFQRNLEDVGGFEEGAKAELLDPCESCGCRIFELTSRPRSPMRVSTPVVEEM